MYRNPRDFYLFIFSFSILQLHGAIGYALECGRHVGWMDVFGKLRGGKYWKPFFCALCGPLGVNRTIRLLKD